MKAILFSILAAIAAAGAGGRLRGLPKYQRPPAWRQGTDAKDIEYTDQNIVVALTLAEKTLMGRKGIDTSALAELMENQDVQLTHRCINYVNDQVNDDSTLWLYQSHYQREGLVPSNVLSDAAVKALEDEYMLLYSQSAEWLEDFGPKPESEIQRQIEWLVNEAATILGHENALKPREVASITKFAQMKRYSVPYGFMGHECLALVRDHFKQKADKKPFYKEFLTALSMKKKKQSLAKLYTDERPSNEDVRNAMNAAFDAPLPWENRDQRRDAKEELSGKQRKRVMSEIGNRWMQKRKSGILTWMDNKELLEKMAKDVCTELAQRLRVHGSDDFFKYWKMSVEEQSALNKFEPQPRPRVSPMLRGRQTPAVKKFFQQRPQYRPPTPPKVKSPPPPPKGILKNGNKKNSPAFNPALNRRDSPAFKPALNRRDSPVLKPALKKRRGTGFPARKGVGFDLSAAPA